jgi:hypothetical protein
MSFHTNVAQLEVGYVTNSYQSVLFKQQAWMGSNQSELVKFIIVDFVCDRFGEKRIIQ